MCERVQRVVRAACSSGGRGIARHLLPPLVGPSQSVVLEYSSPNVAKPFHVGHLRGTLQGQFIANVLRAAGHRVHGVNWLGDWGTQFGLLTQAWRTWGERRALDAADKPLLYLHELYVRANWRASVDGDFAAAARQCFADMEQGEGDALHFWRLANEISRAEFDKVYDRLGVQFDETLGESQCAGEAQRLVDRLLSDGVAMLSRGAVGVFIGSHKDDPLFVALRKSDQSSLYVARDITTALARHRDRQPDRLLYVVDHGQTDHFLSMQGVLDKMGRHDVARLIEHVKCGRVQHMSSRTGKVINADALLDMSVKKGVMGFLKRSRHSGLHELAHVDKQRVKRELGVALLALSLFKQRRTTDYSFDEDASARGGMFDKLLSTTGDSALYVQQVHARLGSLLDRFDAQHTPALHSWPTDSHSVAATLDPALAGRLREQLGNYESVLQRAHDELEPCGLVAYVFQLARLSQRAYVALKVHEQPDDTQQQSLALFRLSRDTMADCLRLLCAVPQPKV